MYNYNILIIAIPIAFAFLQAFICMKARRRCAKLILPILFLLVTVGMIIPSALIKSWDALVFIVLAMLTGAIMLATVIATVGVALWHYYTKKKEEHSR